MLKIKSYPQKSLVAWWMRKTQINEVKAVKELRKNKHGRGPGFEYDCLCVCFLLYDRQMVMTRPLSVW